MKHFNAQTGGRYTYVDDVLNLQELALAINSIFTQCDNFVVSGCEVSGNSISSGFVFLNGELRYFQGATGISSWPRFIYESNSVENVDYASGVEKNGRVNYSCAIAASVPSSNDPVTGAVPQYIRVTSTGALRMKDAFFGKYALLLNAASGEQTVGGIVNFTGAVNVSQTFTAGGNVNVNSGNSQGKMYWDGDDFVIQSRVDNGTIYKFVINNGGGFKFYVGGNLAIIINSSGIETNLGLTAASLVGGSIKLFGNHIFNNNTGSDAGAVNINILGYNGGSSHFRDTNIGNGKGTAIITVTGSTGAVGINGVTTVKSADVAGLILKSTFDKTSNSMLKSIAFRDINDEAMANIGFITSGSKRFTIANVLGDIAITGSSYIDLGPAIKENGTLLSDKYVLKSTYTSDMNDKANASNVYTKSAADQRYGRLSNGLSQFVVGANTAAVLRSHIGAMGQTDVTKLCPTLDNLLSDMANTETKKAQIRRNIGAASASDSYEPILADTGWKKCDGQDDVYARQKGNIVYITGTVRMAHSGELFTLPNGISSPTMSVIFESSYRDWGCVLPGYSRTCSVRYCDHNRNHGVTTYFSMMYMV